MICNDITGTTCPAQSYEITKLALDNPSPPLMPPPSITTSSCSSQASSLIVAPAAAKSLQSCPTLCPTRLPHPWDSPSKNTGLGCHFLLQCMKVKSESEVAQSCPTLSDPMDCSPPGSSIHGIL